MKVSVCERRRRIEFAREKKSERKSKRKCEIGLVSVKSGE